MLIIHLELKKLIKEKKKKMDKDVETLDKDS
jgi:hypothetical protein